MRDPYFGHRDLNGEPNGDRDEWIEWDYLLISALQVIEDFTDRNGLLVWESESEEVDVVAERKIDPFQAAVERRTSRKGYKAAPGETFIPKLVLQGQKWPTHSDWVKQQLEEVAKEEEDDYYEEDDREIIVT